MKFKYKAKKSLDETIEGAIEAENLEQAIESLERKGIIPIIIEPQGKETVSVQGSRGVTNLQLGRWGSKKLTVFTQKLYNLTKSNVELLAALKLLSQNNFDHTEKLLLEDVSQSIKSGMTLSQSFSRHPRYFPLLYVNIVRAGESSGQLKDSFSQLLNYLQQIEELRLKIRQALAYPIFMIIVGAATIFVMLSFILPRLVSMFEDFQAALPLPTRILLAVSNVFKQYWLAAIAIFVVGFFILQKKYSLKAALLFYLKSHLPFVRSLVYKQSVVNFSTSLSLLLKSGVNLLSALGIVAPVIDNPVYIAQLGQVRQDIKEGASFSQALAKFKIFPGFFTQMIKVGEESGRLESVLADIADSYQQEIESDLKIISALIEPAIILVLGLIIGGMVLAVLLPIFNINALVG